MLCASSKRGLRYNQVSSVPVSAMQDGAGRLARNLQRFMKTDNSMGLEEK